jgi:hypothetical protein
VTVVVAGSDASDAAALSGKASNPFTFRPGILPVSGVEGPLSTPVWILFYAESQWGDTPLSFTHYILQLAISSPLLVPGDLGRPPGQEPLGFYGAWIGNPGVGEGAVFASSNGMAGVGSIDVTGGLWCPCLVHYCYSAPVSWAWLAGGSSGRTNLTSLNYFRQGQPWPCLFMALSHNLLLNSVFKLACQNRQLSLGQ